MRLTKRLQVIANMIDDANRIYDIGCDHAYLDIYLASCGFNCVAIDVLPQVIKDAKKNVEASGLKDKVEVILNNGLCNIEVCDKDIVVLSGLGTKSILNIIKNKTIKKIIIQSNDNLYLLRKTMMERNYYISEENIVFDDNKYYITIKFEYGTKKYLDYELYIGPRLLIEKNPILNDYLNKKCKHYEKILLDIPSIYEDKCNEIKKYIDYIKMALK